MEKVTFINSRGQSVVLGDSAPYILTKLEGMGAATADIQTQKAPFQDGVTFIDAVLEPRTPFAEIIVLADNEVEMSSRRMKLLEVFNPALGEGTLIYENDGIKREVKAIAETAPVFPYAGDFKDKMQPALINLYCANPLLLSPVEYTATMQAWLGGFEFPIELDPYMEFETAGNEITIENVGHREAPVVIEFNGPAVNPRVDNLTTGEFIKINRELQAGERLIIETAFGRKRVVFIDEEGNESNAMHYIDLESTFWRLAIGENTISYMADSGAEEAVVNIKFRFLYMGV